MCYFFTNTTNTYNTLLYCLLSNPEQFRRFVSLSAMAEWHARGLATYGTVKLLAQTDCYFIDDNTCVAVDWSEATNAKGDKMRYM